MLASGQLATQSSHVRIGEFGVISKTSYAWAEVPGALGCRSPNWSSKFESRDRLLRIFFHRQINAERA